MASPAFAFDHDEPTFQPVRRIQAADAVAAPQHGAGTWHRQQAERLTEAFGNAAVRREERLPLRLKAAVFLGGGLLGWAMPIALAWTLTR